MRILWAIAGILSLAFGTIGIILPLVPTVPFMILAAFFFAQSSPQLHDWLVNHRVFGPSIQEWRRSGAIGLRGKQMATISIVLVFALSLGLGFRLLILVIQAVTLTFVLIFIWTRPTGSTSESDIRHPDHPDRDS